MKLHVHVSLQLKKIFFSLKLVWRDRNYLLSSLLVGTFILCAPPPEKAPYSYVFHRGEWDSQTSAWAQNLLMAVSYKAVMASEGNREKPSHCSPSLQRINQQEASNSVLLFLPFEWRCSSSVCTKKSHHWNERESFNCFLLLSCLTICFATNVLLCWN